LPRVDSEARALGAGFRPAPQSLPEAMLLTNSLFVGGKGKKLDNTNNTPSLTKRGDFTSNN
jgi:hypothetical protein